MSLIVEELVGPRVEKYQRRLIRRISGGGFSLCDLLTNPESSKANLFILQSLLPYSIMV